MVSTHLKNMSQNGNLPQVGVKRKNIWNHQRDTYIYIYIIIGSVYGVFEWDAHWNVTPAKGIYIMWNLPGDLETGSIPKYIWVIAYLLALYQITWNIQVVDRWKCWVIIIIIINNNNNPIHNTLMLSKHHSHDFTHGRSPDLLQLRHLFWWRTSQLN